jgi:hypothetical protein
VPSELEALYTTTALDELLLVCAAACVLAAELVVLLDELLDELLPHATIRTSFEMCCPSNTPLRGPKGGYLGT